MHTDFDDQNYDNTMDKITWSTGFMALFSVAWKVSLFYFKLALIASRENRKK